MKFIWLLMITVAPLTFSMKYENLVLEGGGAKSISYVGAMIALENSGYFQNDAYTFKKIAGTSSGCFTGFLISLDIAPKDLQSLAFNEDIFKKLLNIDMDSLFSSEDNPDTFNIWNSMIKTNTLLTKAKSILSNWYKHESPGLSDETRFVKFINEYVLPLSPHDFNNDTLTFNLLKEKTDHSLYCFAVHLNSGKIKEFSEKETPYESILKAVYYSMSIPGIFKPLLDNNGEIFIDGSLLYNFPIDFDDYGDDSNQLNKQTLGLSLMSKPSFSKNKLSSFKNNKDQNKVISDNKFANINTLEFINKIYSILLERDMYLNYLENLDRTIYLDSPLQGFTYNLNMQDVSKAIHIAHLNTGRFIDKATTLSSQVL